MELHSKRSSIIAKRLWNFLRITFLMMRKGLISKKKLIMDINLFFKRGKLIRRSLSNLISHHHHHNHHRTMTRGGAFARRDYEFSCSNSPVFFHVPSSKRHRHHHHHHHNHHIHLPCMNPPLVFDEIESQEDNDYESNNNALALVPTTPEYTFNICLDGYDLASGENNNNQSPLISPFPIRICEYSSDQEDVIEGGNVHVDHEAEEFITKFYEQLRAQSRVQLLQY